MILNYNILILNNYKFIFNYQESIIFNPIDFYGIRKSIIFNPVDIYGIKKNLGEETKKLPKEKTPKGFYLSILYLLLTTVFHQILFRL
jgi:hypothetical protein